MRTLLVAILLALFFAQGAGATHRSFRYTRHRLFELAARADVIVAGTIVEVSSTTFDLSVERSIVGTPPKRLHVKRFKDWTCASRWTEYAAGQRVLLFLAEPGRRETHSILGAGGEGEMPLADLDVIVRSYRVRDYEYAEHDVAGGTALGARIALNALAAAVVGFRDSFAWRFSENGYLPIARVGPRESMARVDAFAETSKTARHLFDEASSCRTWTGTRPAADVALDLERLRLISANDNGVTGRARLTPGASPDPFGANVDSRFGSSCAFVGDVDRDGIEDLAVGAPRDSYVGHFHGAVWILFLDATGSVRAKTEIREGAGGFDAKMDRFSQFGEALAPLGDLDDDGVPDLAVGSSLWPEFERWHGGVWVLHLMRDGTVRRAVEIGGSEPLKRAGVADKSGLGCSLANLGDLDGDGTIELAIGQDPNSSVDRHGRAVFIASIARGGEVRGATRLQDRERGLGEGWFGEALARIGDVDGDGITELAIADTYDDDGGSVRGAIWIAFLARDGSLRKAQKISDWQGGFTGAIGDWERLGQALAGPGDIDGDTIPDLLAGASSGVWTLILREDGTVKSHRKLENVLDASAAQAHFGDSLAVGTLAKPWELPTIACGGRRADSQLHDRFIALLRFGRGGALRAR